MNIFFDHDTPPHLSSALSGSLERRVCVALGLDLLCSMGGRGSGNSRCGRESSGWCSGLCYGLPPGSHLLAHPQVSSLALSARCISCLDGCDLLLERCA